MAVVDGQGGKIWPAPVTLMAIAPSLLGPLGSSSPLMLASVQSLEEALLVRDWGADIIDFKDPSTGALGAIPVDNLQRILASLATDGACPPCSVTCGDLPLQPREMTTAIEQRLTLRARWIKLGFDGGSDPGSITAGIDCIAACAPYTLRQSLVAVVFAENPLPATWLNSFKKYGFDGVLVDSKIKSGPGLCKLWDMPRLQKFVADCHQLNLMAGLAGKLQIDQLDQLLSLQADIFGFRSALCKADRAGQLSIQHMQEIRNRINSRQTCLS